MRDEEMLAEIEGFLEGFNQPTYRGVRINGGGPGRYLVIQHGWSGTAGRRWSGYSDPLIFW